jgi:hypothetical protein
LVQNHQKKTEENSLKNNCEQVKLSLACKLEQTKEPRKQEATWVHQEKSFWESKRKNSIEI